MSLHILANETSEISPLWAPALLLLVVSLPCLPILALALVAWFQSGKKNKSN